MTICTLVAPPTAENLPGWEFEHTMAHNDLLGAMSTAPGNPYQTVGLARFSALPYILDPQRNSFSWHQDHGQAHQDLQDGLPGFFNAAGGTINPMTDLFDMDFDDERLLTWWTFANFQQHLTAESVLPRTLPLLP